MTDVVVGGAGSGLDLDLPVSSLLSSIPWEGAPQPDPDRQSAGDFFEQL